MQACAEGNQVLFGTICLDNMGADIEKQVANKVYNDSRAGLLQIGGFPQFDGLLKALKEGSNSTSDKTFSVCVQRQSKLVILQSLASKFVNADATKDSAIEAINKHNSLYNSDGDFWEEDERTGPLQMCCFVWNVFPFLHPSAPPLLAGQGMIDEANLLPSASKSSRQTCSKKRMWLLWRIRFLLAKLLY